MDRKEIFGFTTALLVMIGLVLLWFSNSYDVDLTQLNILEEESGNIRSEPVYKVEFTGYVLNIIGQFLITLGASVFIAVFILESISKAEKDKFENKLMEFQKETAKDAISSAFDTLIPNEFLELLKTDIIGAKLIRRNVNWTYFIKEKENDKLELRRLISYDLSNISSEEQEDKIKLTTGENDHVTTALGKSNHLVINDEKIDLELKAEMQSGGFQKRVQSIKIPPNSTITVHNELIQTFESRYIYETHTTRHALMDLIINVNIPEGYEFDLTQTTSCELKVKDDGDYLVFKSDGAVYKGQGIELYCSKKGDNKV